MEDKLLLSEYELKLLDKKAKIVKKGKRNEHTLFLADKEKNYIISKPEKYSKIFWWLF